jgi:hypothetical protein
MPREELVIGIKNGLARGQSLENAIESLIAAGYNPDEVKDAATYANAGVTGKMGVVNASAETLAKFQGQQTPDKFQEKSEVKAQPGQLQTSQQITQQLSQQQIQSPTKRKIKILFIVLGILVAILAVMLGVSIFFGKVILQAFFGG